MPDELNEAFKRTVEEGERRLERSWPELLATGAVGGLDIVIGILSRLLVYNETHSHVLAGLGFSIGFIAVTLANSELFTENFLVPVAALAADRSRWIALVRLWCFTLAMNLMGGFIGIAVVMRALPRLHPTAVELSTHYSRQGIGTEALAAAALGGAVITLMTWMERGTESTVGKLAAALVAGFVVGAGPLNHAVVMSEEMFAGLFSGAPFGYLGWLGALGWTVLGNIIGGVGFVTLLRLVQVGQEQIERT